MYPPIWPGVGGDLVLTQYLNIHISHWVFTFYVLHAGKHVHFFRRRGSDTLATFVAPIEIPHSLFEIALAWQKFSFGVWRIYLIQSTIYIIKYGTNTVLKSCYFLTTVNREKQSVQYSIRIYLFLFLKHIQFSCLKLVIRLVNIAIML